MGGLLSYQNSHGFPNATRLNPLTCLIALDYLPTSLYMVFGNILIYKLEYPLLTLDEDFASVQKYFWQNTQILSIWTVFGTSRYAGYLQFYKCTKFVDNITGHSSHCHMHVLYLSCRP